MFKGKKMAGHLGQDNVTTLNLTVFRVDVERGLILIKGAVPGTEGSYVKIRDAIKRAAPADAPKPGAIRKAQRRGRPGRRRRPRRPPKPTKPGAKTMKLDVITLDGGKAGSIELPDDIFGIDEIRGDILQRVRDLAAGQAPRRHPQDPDPQRSLAHRQEDVQAEGHRRRPSRLAPGGPVRRRRQGPRPGRPQPRLRPAQEGPRPGACATPCRPRPSPAR